MYIHAILAKVRLESEGISVILENENTVLANPLYSYALGGVVLRVAEDDLERSKEIISKMHYEEVDEKPSFCPRCDCEEIDSSSRTILGFKGHSSFKCRDCGHEWIPFKF